MLGEFVSSTESERQRNMGDSAQGLGLWYVRLEVRVELLIDQRRNNEGDVKSGSEP